MAEEVLKLGKHLSSEDFTKMCKYLTKEERQILLDEFLKHAKVLEKTKPHRAGEMYR